MNEYSGAASNSTTFFSDISQILRQPFRISMGSYPTSKMKSDCSTSGISFLSPSGDNPAPPRLRSSSSAIIPLALYVDITGVPNLLANVVKALLAP